MKAVTGAQMREIERITISEMGIPSLILMENAAIRVLERCLPELDDKKKAKVMVVAGPGSNGGDGFALARHLFLKDVEVGIIFVGDIGAVRGDSAVNMDAAQKLGIPVEAVPMTDSMLDVPYTLETCDLVVDAMFGTGLDRPLEGSYEYMVDMINTYAKRVISIDIPSGVNADTGRVMGCAVRADKTVTLGLPKVGLMLHPGREYAGEVSVADISIPKAAVKQVDTDTEVFMTGAEALALLPKRGSRTNKGSFGRVLVLAGSAEMPGAAVLAAKAAYRIGAGLVRVCAVQQAAGVIHAHAVECVTRIVPDKGGMFCRKSFEAIEEDLKEASVVLIGPGIGRGPHVSEFAADILLAARVPLIIDADALYAVSEDVNILKDIKTSRVITPHPGEMSRLTALATDDILEDTKGVAGVFSREFDTYTLLKDAGTIVASPSGSFYINTTGSNALSKGGSGDVLAGIIAGLAAQGLDLFTASMLGAYIHGRAGELASEKLTAYGVNASDIIDYITEAIKR